MSAPVIAEPARPSALQEHLNQIFSAVIWRDNPLAIRELRRDFKRNQPHLSYFWTLLVLSLVTAAALWGIYALRRRGFWIPQILGGSPGVALCIAIAGIHSWFISAAAQKHSVRFIQREANANTLTSLLTIPQPPFQILLCGGVYPWLAAMRIAVIGLPFYALCVALGLPLLDLALLYVVYAAISVAIPAWSWPILSEKSAFVPTVQPQGQTAGAALGQQQAQQKAGSQPTGFNPGSIFTFIGLFGFILPGLMRGGIRQGMASLREYFPQQLIELFPTCFLSWPLLMGRALITPFDWFGHPVPPVPFLLLSFLIGRYVQTIRSAEYLQVGAYRDLPALPTYIPIRKLGGALRIARLFIATGYLWKWGIVNGGLAFLTRTTSPSGAPGLAGLAFLLFFIGGWRLLIRGGSVGLWFSAQPMPPERGIHLAVSASDSARYLIEPLAFSLLFYLGCCTMAQKIGFHGPLTSMAAQMSFIAIGGAALGFCVRRAGGEFATVASIAAVLMIPLISIGPPAAAQFSILSPTLGMARYADLGFIRWNPELAARKSQFRGLFAYLDAPPSWWRWPIAMTGVGFCLIPFWRLRRGIKPGPESAPIPVKLNPSRCGTEVYNDWLFERNQKITKETTPAAARVISTFQTLSDNAVAVREMRSRLRGQLSAKSVRGGVAALLIITILMIAAPAVTTTFGGSFAPYLLPGVPALSAAVLLCWYIALFWISAAIGLGMMPVAFAPEREKSTLAFVLLSPMCASEIVAGKLAGYLISTSIVTMAITLWTFILSMVLAGSAVSALTLWWKASITALVATFTLSTVGLAFAALFPRKGLQTGCSLIFGILAIQIPIQLGLGTGRLLRATLLGSTFEGWNAESYWYAFLAGSGVLSVFGFLIAVWGVRRMRKGDIAAESAKQA